MSASPPSVLVIRRRYLGDIVLLGSVFRNLRLHWPLARITALVEEPYTSVLALNPDVNGVLALPRRVREWPGFLRQLRRAHITHVFDFDNNERTAVLAFLSGAPFRATLWHEGRRPRLDRFYTHRQFDPPAIHERRPLTEYYLSLLASAGVPIARREIRLVPREADLAFVRELLGRLFGPGIPPNTRFLLVHPGSRSPCRLWPPEQFGEVCRRVTGELGVRVVLTAGPGEAAMLDQIRSHAGTDQMVVVPFLSVPQFAALAAEADLMLCHDSGPMHVAAAVGTRVVALLGSQNPVLFAPPGEGHIVLQPPLPCTTCVAPGECLPDNSYRNYCVRNLPVEPVFTAIRDQLARPAALP